MGSMAGRVALGLVVVAAAVVLLIALKDEGGEEGASGGGNTAAQTGSESGGKDSRAGGEQAKPALPTIVVKGGKPVGGVAELVFSAGDRIRFKVESDVADEIHLHGYELTKDIEAGGTAGFDFDATIEGVFEAELEDRGVEILELQVNP